MRGESAERVVVLTLRLLAVTFAVVGILFVAVPSGVLDVISDVGEWFGNETRAPHTQQYLWLALGFAYMVVITGICLVAQADVVRYRPLLLVLAPARRPPHWALSPSSYPGTRFHLPAQLPRRRLPRSAGALALLARGADRTQPGAWLTARAGAGRRRAAHAERDLRGDGAGRRTAAGG